jgi:O-antigen/teichoic acid export membrane protein
MAVSNHIKAKQLISTAYLTLVVIMTMVTVCFAISFKYINYSNFFGDFQGVDVTRKLVIETVSIVTYLFIMRFVLQLLNSILDALQKLYWSKIIFFFSQLLILTALIIVKYFFVPNIFVLGLVYSIAPLMCLFIGSIIFFIKHKFLAPSIFDFDTKLIKELFSMGFKFFLIQINMLILFQSSNFIIINYIGSSEVVKYNIAFNLFSMMNIAFSTVAAPYWAAYSSAWFQNDFEWIKQAQKRLIVVWFIVALISFVVLICSTFIYKLWLGNEINIPFDLSLSIYVYMLLFTFGMIYNTFINSTGKVLFQTISLTALTLIYIPLVIFMIRYLDLGLIAIPISLCIISLYTLILAPIQSRRLLSGTTRGILSK